MVNAKLSILGISTENIAFVTSTGGKKKSNVSAFNSSYVNVRNRTFSIYLIMLLLREAFQLDNI